jgi:hypothetical protein
MRNLPSKVKLACLLPGLLILNQLVYSQTTTVINYQTWTGATGCNIFGSSTNVPVTINGTNSTVAHSTNQGQPTYDGAPNNAVDLTAQPIVIK